MVWRRVKTPRIRAADVFALGVFFAFGAVMSLAAAISLFYPGSPLEPMWRLNPGARGGLAAIGSWAVLVMVLVSVACAGSALGLWLRAEWGRRLALGVLTTNLVGDLAGALIRHDLRPLIGLPIGGAMIAYLLSARVRHRFASGSRGSGG